MHGAKILKASRLSLNCWYQERNACIAARVCGCVRMVEKTARSAVLVFMFVRKDADDCAGHG